MLSRHFLRVKVLQSLYAYIVTENSSLDIAEKELDKSISETYDLEVYLFSSLLEMRDIAENQIEDAKGKFFRFLHLLHRCTSRPSLSKHSLWAL